LFKPGNQVHQIEIDLAKTDWVTPPGNLQIRRERRLSGRYRDLVQFS